MWSLDLECGAWIRDVECQVCNEECESLKRGVLSGTYSMEWEAYGSLQSVECEARVLQEAAGGM